MMHKFSKTGEYAKKRLKIALAEDRSTISASDNMTQIKKEIKSVIQRHMNINDDYTIVEAKTPYGISLYDHIALDGKSVKENQTIAK